MPADDVERASQRQAARQADRASTQREGDADTEGAPSSPAVVAAFRVPRGGRTERGKTTDGAERDVTGSSVVTRQEFVPDPEAEAAALADPEFVRRVMGAVPVGHKGIGHVGPVHKFWLSLDADCRDLFVAYLVDYAAEFEREGRWWKHRTDPKARLLMLGKLMSRYRNTLTDPDDVAF